MDARRRLHVTFPLDMGYLLSATSFVLLPYYFWRTQRWRGMGKMLALAGIWLGTYDLWGAAAWILALDR